VTTYLNPIELIKQNRTEARKLADANADLCFLALADTSGKASVRTLVMRDIRENQFTLFMNKSSPKWNLLNEGADYELLLWYPSQQHQYRIKGTATEIDTRIVKENWSRRPIGSKYLDYVYTEFAPQSSQLSGREALLAEIQRLKKTYKADEMQAPPEVSGMILIADQIEVLNLNREDRIHSRQLFRLKNEKWEITDLIP